MAAVLVQLEWQEGRPEFGRVIPYVTLRLSTTARSMHHAGLRAQSHPSNHPICPKTGLHHTRGLAVNHMRPKLIDGEDASPFLAIGPACGRVRADAPLGVCRGSDSSPGRIGVPSTSWHVPGPMKGDGPSLRIESAPLPRGRTDLRGAAFPPCRPWRGIRRWSRYRLPEALAVISCVRVWCFRGASLLKPVSYP